VLDLRGNLNTRLAKLDRGEYEGIILAAAGVLRLGWEDRISEHLDPAAGSRGGAGGPRRRARADDEAMLERLRGLDHAATVAATTAERAFLRALEGGCQVPIGALGELRGGRLTLDGLVALRRRDDPARLVRRRTGDADALGRGLAAELLRRGAGEILAQIRREVPAARPDQP
jgi:hydroxymethylbilane synthase